VVVVAGIVATIAVMRPPRTAAPVVTAPVEPPIAPPPVVETAPAPVVKAKPKPIKKVPAKDTTPEAPKLKPIEPKVVHQ
jgi:hypothetical protein